MHKVIGIFFVCGTATHIAARRIDVGGERGRAFRRGGHGANRPGFIGRFRADFDALLLNDIHKFHDKGPVRDKK